jgi:hypothetical protein
MPIPYKTVLVFHSYCVTLQSSDLPPSGRSATCVSSQCFFGDWSKSASFPIVQPYPSALETQSGLGQVQMTLVFFLYLPSRNGIQKWAGTADLHIILCWACLIIIVALIDRWGKLIRQVCDRRDFSAIVTTLESCSIYGGSYPLSLTFCIYPYIDSSQSLTSSTASPRK